MHKKLLVLICLLILSSLLCACYDAVEITDYAYVTMMGVDVGVKDRLRFTFQIPQFNVGGDGGGGGTGEIDEEKEIITIEDTSLLSTVEIVNSNIPLILNFMHLKAIVVSEEFAMSGEMGEVIGTLLRYRQIRPSTHVIVSKDPAETFIKGAKPYLNALVTDSLEDLVNKYKSTGMFPKFNFNDMEMAIKSEDIQMLGIYGAINKGENYVDEGPLYNGEYQIPGDYYAGDVPRKGGQDIELLGSVVSNGDKMVGKLTGFETQMVLLVQNKLKRVAFTIPDPEDSKYVIPIEIKEFEKPKISVDLSGEKPKIYVKLKLEGDITSIQSGINYENPKEKKKIEHAFEQFLIEGIQRTFAKCQIFETDVFEFGTVAIKHFWTIPEWENFNWSEKFLDAELQAEVDFTVRRTGKFVKTMPDVDEED